MDEKRKAVLLALYDIVGGSARFGAANLKDIERASKLPEEEVRKALSNLGGLWQLVSENNHRLTEQGQALGRILDERRYRSQERKKDFTRTLLATLLGVVVGALLTNLGEIAAWVRSLITTGS